jgi:hypothetical protein
MTLMADVQVRSANISRKSSFSFSENGSRKVGVSSAGGGLSGGPNRSSANRFMEVSSANGSSGETRTSASALALDYLGNSST